MLVGLTVVALWEWSRLDLPLIRLYATEQGFAWRDHWLTAKVLHDGARLIGWGFLSILLASAWRPQMLIAAMPKRERVWWILTTLVCVALIPLMKRASTTSCPWSLLQFGGDVTRYVPTGCSGLGTAAREAAFRLAMPRPRRAATRLVCHQGPCATRSAAFPWRGRHVWRIAGLGPDDARSALPEPFAMDCFHLLGGQRHQLAWVADVAWPKASRC